MKTITHTKDPDRDFDGASSTRSVGEFTDAQGVVHSWGDMGTSASNTMLMPSAKCLIRFEVYDLVHKVWVAASGGVTGQLRRLGERQLEVFLKTHRAGVRMIPYAGEPDNSHIKALDKALKVGLLTLSGRTYKLSTSPTGNVRLTGASGSMTWTREALMDAIQRKSL